MSELKMFALKTSDVSFLVGRQVIQLALGQHEFQLRFDLEISVSIQDIITVQKPSGQPIQMKANNPVQTKELYFLLGKTIESVQISNVNILTLEFSDKSKIILSPSVSGYESYVVWNKGDFLVV